MASSTSIHVRIRVDFGSGSSVGPGKIVLLEQIGQCGSLSKAARTLGLSYRRAWLLLDDINTSFEEPVVVTATGGRQGGGARLTPFGDELIRLYRSVERNAERFAARALRSLAPSVSPGRSSLRRPLARAARRMK